MSEPRRIEQNDKEMSVLKAATAVFLAHGFSAATTDMIQRKASVSKATMYACFPNKEAMFAAVIEQECATMAATIQAIQAAPGDIAKTLTDIGLSYLTFVVSPTALALYRVVVAEAPRFPDLARRFYLAGPKVVTSMVAARLKEAAQDGEIDIQSVGVDAAATLFISLVRTEGQLESLTHPDAQPSAAQLDHWVQLAVTTFMAAFGAPGVRRESPPR
ncbi:TetR/AcrR family transcriptional regulator [Ralstonia solanacearum]|uniref:TetR family transcriptional regulator n=2 Tax=Ralstonia solanacearum species complex TaxID=3116862 RepID=A0AAD0SC06_RALSL|nr:TetR/AcrR family transcriptional regulator [Ralstonia solanacearum]AXV83858.1 TetR family transcriptional regulator [Ralstonia solanacearum]AXW54992.1 TetR family transcriptional regulator [Ralstonia solanacearum]